MILENVVGWLLPYHARPERTKERQNDKENINLTNSRGHLSTEIFIFSYRDDQY